MSELLILLGVLGTRDYRRRLLQEVHHFGICLLGNASARDDDCGVLRCGVELDLERELSFLRPYYRAVSADR